MSLTKKINEYFVNKGFYVVTKKDFNKYLEVMINSFIGYPLIEFITGGFDFEKLKKFLSVTIKSMDDNCITISESKDINGIICFYKPRTEPNTLSFILNGVFLFFYNFGFLRTIKSMIYMIKMGKIMQKYRKDNDIYIYFLATSPKVQNQGIGSKLLKVVLDYCNENGYGAYLETNEEKNVSFYEKNGFELMESINIKSDNNMKLFSFYKNV